MSSWLALLVTLLLVQSSPGPQTRTDALADPTFYAVSYVETTASAVSKASAMLKQYRDASAKQDGFIAIDLFEQIGRPGHFVVYETWRDQKAFDARDGSAQKQLLSGLQPLRVSDYDQRPYKTLAVKGVPGLGRSQAPRGAVYVIAHVDFAPNPQAQQAPAALLTRLAEASRQEAGNLRFDVTQHTMRANHFTVVEGWQNQQAFDAHVAAAHTKQYRDTVQPMTGSPLDERVYRSLD